MEITQVQLKFVSVPLLRSKWTVLDNRPFDNFKITDKQSQKIIIKLPGQESIDIGSLHNLQVEQYGKTGIIYHYIIKGPLDMAGQDGSVFYCRPLVYQNELDSNNPGSNINQSILIGLSGMEEQALPQTEIDSLIKLCVFLVKQEGIKYEDVKFYHELMGGSVQIPEWQDIKNQIKQSIIDYDLYQGIIEKGSVNGIDVSSGMVTLMSDSKYNSFEAISKVTGVPIATLTSANPQILDGANIPPKQVVFMPKTQIDQGSTAFQQSSVGKALKSIINDNVYYAKNIIKKATDEELIPVYGINDQQSKVIEQSTMYGGKKRQVFVYDYPGYHNAYIRFDDTMTGQEAMIIPFLMSPSSAADQRSNTQQMTKTNAGWFVMRTGKNPASLNLTGYMLDTYDNLERHAFIENYRTYVQDTRNSNLELVNKYTTTIIVEGYEYYGFIQSISFSKTANQQFLYQYNISFVVMNDLKVYNPKFAVKNINAFKKTDETVLASSGEVTIATEFKVTPSLSPAQLNPLTADASVVGASKLSIADTIGKILSGGSEKDRFPAANLTANPTQTTISSSVVV